MKYIAKKFLTLIITLFIVSLLAFLAFQIIPGDPTTKILGTEATEEAIAALRAELGLDRPVFVRYFDWLGSFVTGDFGMSYSYYMPVSDMLADKLPITFLLTIMAFLFTVVLSLPLGISSLPSHWVHSSACKSSTFTQYSCLLINQSYYYTLKHSLAFWNYDFCRGKARHCMGSLLSFFDSFQCPELL